MDNKLNVEYNSTYRAREIYPLAKNLILSICIIFSCASTLDAQTPIHEIRVNLLYPTFKIIDFQYEYHNAGKLSVGISAAASINDNDDYHNSISVFSRYYTGQKIGRGFFVEGHIDLLRNNSPITFTTLFAGPSLGYKHYFGSRIHMELLAGLGIHLKHWRGSELNTLFFPRAGILVGSWI